MNNFYFLSGLPRSGSTVLCSILNQHPEIYASKTSSLIDMLGAVCREWNVNPSSIAERNDENDIYEIMRGIIRSKNHNIKKSIIIDKNRGWVVEEIMETMKVVLGYEPKIIATVRSTSECASSFVRLVRPDNLDFFLYNSPLIKHLKTSYSLLYDAYKKNNKNILFIDYDDLLKSPDIELDKISSFLGIEKFKYDFENLDSSIVMENDEIAWGIPNLHKIEKSLKKVNHIPAKDVLGHFEENFNQPKFWIGETLESKKKKIDISVSLAMEGKLDESYKILCEAQLENPLCNKIAFNMGWFYLGQGKLQEGMQLLSKGRYENCFGNRKPDVPTPIWDGKTIGTILYFLEGGLGDQIHALKYIQDLNKKGCDVIVSCSPELFPIVKKCKGIKMIVEHNASGGVYHDFWLPSMSVLIPLNYEYKDISGEPYIYNFKLKNKSNIKTIGVRWHGNPQFEHAQNRKFPLDPFFDQLRNIKANFISLQRDEGAEFCPDFIKKVPLNNWQETMDIISECDIVVSSCTSVAHLSAAMGIETCVIVPVLNYYIWSFPGDRSPYYNSVKLFRQKKFGEWDDPIKELGIHLKSRE